MDFSPNVLVVVFTASDAFADHHIFVFLNSIFIFHICIDQCLSVAL